MTFYIVDKAPLCDILTNGNVREFNATVLDFQTIEIPHLKIKQTKTKTKRTNKQTKTKKRKKESCMFQSIYIFRTR